MLLEIKDLTKMYLRGTTPFAAVNHLDLTLKPGDFVSIVGRSGSGKSTLLNLIAGITKPTSGQVIADGRYIYSLQDHDISLFRNERLGYVPQSQSLLGNLNVLENIMLPFYLFKRTGDCRKRARSLIEQLGISHLAEAYPRQLSGGELRRAAIARALLNAPDILMADEPTSDLDAETTKEIMRLFKALSHEGIGHIQWILGNYPDNM